MLQLPNFGHMTTCTKQFESYDKKFLVTSWKEILAPYFSFQNIFILRWLGAPSFDEIIKIAIMFIKTTFQDSITVKRIRKNTTFICIS